MLTVLLVAPDPDAIKPLCDALTRDGFAARVGHGEGTMDKRGGTWAGRPPDLVVADLRRAFDALPLRALRRQLADAWGEEPGDIPPLLTLLGARQLVARDWLALTDDVLAPPHAPDELVARARLLLFRRRHIEDGGAIRFKDVTLDPRGGVRNHVTGTTVALTPREFGLLYFLLTHRGRLYARERLLDYVWGVDYAGGARTVDIHIRRLRAKLPPEASASLESRRGFGYGFAV